MYECAQSAITPNNLNLPVYDLHEHEARDQILMNFNSLAQTTSTISERHLKRCENQKERIEALRQRVFKCKEKIETLSGLNQAIVFVSPGQYPKKYEFDLDQNKSHFSDFLAYTQVHKMDMEAQYIVKHDIKELGQDAKLKIKDLQEFVLYLYGKLKGKRKTVFEMGISNKKEITSLGKIPSSIRYIDSLTVLNTHINPYRKYEVVTVPTFTQQQKQRKKKKVKVPDSNDAISNYLTQFKKDQLESDNKNYRPKDKQFIEDQFDQNLGLDNIVGLHSSVNDDTTNFTNAKKKTVVRDTLAGKKSQSSIQGQREESKVSQNQTKSQIAPRQQNKGNPPPPPPQNNLPPPPPPPSSLPPPPPPLGMMPPPPPPPPPLMMPPPPPPPSLNPPPSLASALPASSSGRSAFLKEIENPNHMKRLKRTVTKEYTGVPNAQKPTTMPSSGQASQPSQSAAPKQPMSMMDALKAKIQQRYLAIHPERQQNQEYEHDDY